MLFLGLSPALLVAGETISMGLLLLGATLSVANTRIALVFGLMAMPFYRFDHLPKWKMAILYGAGATWFVFEMWMMWQGFRIPGAIL